MFFTRKPEFEYGYIKGKPSRIAHRRNTKTGVVEFILWDKGEHGHLKPYWHRMDKSWWVDFVSY